MLKSLKTNTLADRLTERMLFIVNEIASNTVHRDEGGDQERK